VIAPANTGNDNKSNTAVTLIAHKNNGKKPIFIPLAFILKIVTIKFIAPAIDEIPAKCKEKIPKSTAPPECAYTPDNGGYTVQPHPTPDSTKLDINNKASAGDNNQKLILFKRGNAMSGDAINNGINQFPKAPSITGITIKKIIMNACAVTTTL
jgi:hypothetical protein